MKLIASYEQNIHSSIQLPFQIGGMICAALISGTYNLPA